MHGRKLALAILICAAGGVAQAADCRKGDLRGATSPNGPPDQNIQCQVLGRIFCALSDYRNAGIEQQAAVDRTADWLTHLGQTGSHVTADYRPAARTAAEYVYGHDEMPPWTAYNYAVWTCGVNQRIADPAAQRAIAGEWETAAQECRRQFPGEGDGSGNEKLKQCLDAAMRKLVKQASAKP